MVMGCGAGAAAEGVFSDVEECARRSLRERGLLELLFLLVLRSHGQRSEDWGQR